MWSINDTVHTTWHLRGNRMTSSCCFRCRWYDRSERSRLFWTQTIKKTSSKWPVLRNTQVGDAGHLHPEAKTTTPCLCNASEMAYGMALSLIHHMRVTDCIILMWHSRGGFDEIKTNRWNVSNFNVTASKLKIYTSWFSDNMLRLFHIKKSLKWLYHFLLIRVVAFRRELTQFARLYLYVLFSVTWWTVSCIQLLLKSLPCTPHYECAYYSYLTLPHRFKSTARS